MSRTEIAIAGLHYPVTALGPGTRLGIWVQGCSIRCGGCMSQDTWDPATGPGQPVGEVVEASMSLVGAAPDGPDQLDGITISGGEPLDQAPAVAELIAGLRQATTERWPGREIDVLLYSGHRWRDITARWQRIIEAVDAIVPEPYLASAGAGPLWRGSGNQPLIPTSDLGHRRYSSSDARAGAADERPVQVVASQDRTVTIIGVPRRGDLARVERQLTEAGVTLEGVSWRP